MTMRKVTAGRGAAWINESIGSLKNIGMVFWSQALIIGLLGSIPFLGMLQGVLALFFYGSLILCLSNSKGQYNAFSGFQNGNFFRILPILLLNIAASVIVVITLWPELKLAIDSSMNGQQLSNEQALAIVLAVFKHMLWMVPMLILLHWVSSLAIPLATIGEQHGMDAIKQATKAVFSNLPAMIVNLICLILVMVIVSIICIIPISIIGAALASNQTLMQIVLIPFTTVLAAVLLAMMSANMLFAYRDIFGASEENTTNDSEVLI